MTSTHIDFGGQNDVIKGIELLVDAVSVQSMEVMEI